MLAAPVKFLTLAATIVGFEALATFFVSEFIADRAASVLVCTRHISREPLVDVVVGVADRAGGDFVVSREPLVDAGCDVVVSVADRVHVGFAFTGLVIHLHCAQAMVAINNDGHFRFLSCACLGEKQAYRVPFLLLLLADMMRARDSACLAVRFCARGPEGLALIRRPAPNIVVLVRRDTRRTEYRSFLLICARVPPFHQST